jgi:hypothetical protein
MRAGPEDRKEGQSCRSGTLKGEGTLPMQKGVAEEASNKDKSGR